MNSAPDSTHETESVDPGLKLMTSGEVAALLKLHPQVVNRKLQAGEIPGYKLGKDWRVSETQLLDYLERHSNQRSPESIKANETRSFWQDGKLKTIPSARSKRLLVLKEMVSRLESGRTYSEEEINAFIEPMHPDVCTLRREFIINKLMVRKNGKYKVVGWNR